MAVNGVLEAQTAFTTPWSAINILQIGRSKVAGVFDENRPGDIHAGAIDDVRAYAGVLTDQEVLDLYSSIGGAE
jgi:hypothetical protein